MDSEIDKLLSSVERRVLDEVTLGWRRPFVGLVCLVALGFGVRWMFTVEHLASQHRPIGVDIVGLSMLGAACLASLVTAVWQRFRAVCISAIISGIAVVAMLGCYWTASSGGSPAVSALVLAGVAAALAMTWTTVALTPIERSHPDAVRSGQSYPHAPFHI